MSRRSDQTDDVLLRKLPSTSSAGTSDIGQHANTSDRPSVRRITTRLSAAAQQRDPRSRSSGLERTLSDGVKEIFVTLGRPPSGGITEAELTEGLERMRLPCSHEIVRTIFDEADRNRDGIIHFDELLSFVRQREDEIAAAFSRLTPRGATNDITFESLKYALSDLGVDATDRQVAAFLTHLDRDETGSVSIEEFTSFVYLLPRVDVAAAFETWLSNHVGVLDTDAEPGQTMIASEPTTGSRASDLAVFVAGAVAGVVSRTATAPLDRLKMLMQVGGAARNGSAEGVTPLRPNGVLSGLRAIYRQGGFLAFFQGNTANVIKVMPESGVKFWAYDAAKAVICADPRHPRVQERLMAGAFAGAASCVAIYPLEVAKTRLAVASPDLYQGVLHCMREAVRHEGPLALYKGLGASLIGIMPFSAVDLALYNTFKAELRRRTRSEPSTLTMLGCGALSSSLAQLATYPLALAKTRLQASGMPGYAPGYDGLAGCILDTIKSEGCRGLYRGIVPNLLKAVPSISISYVVFENVKSGLLLRGWSQAF